MKITRAYNSQSSLLGVFGNKWWSTLDDQVVVKPNGDVTYLREDGAARTFVLNSGIYVPPSGFDAALTLLGGEYTLTYPNGDVRHYPILGPAGTPNFLYRIVDRNQNAVTFTRSVGGIAVTDRSNRTISAILNGQGLVDHLVDPISRSTFYHYTGNDLTGVNYPGNRTAFYNYNPGSFMNESKDPAYHKGAHHLFYTYSNDSLNMITDEKDELGNPLLHIVHYNGAYYNNSQTIFIEPGGCPSCAGGGGGGTYNFDPKGLFTGGLDAGGNPFTYGHDGDFNRTSSLDANNHPTSMTYDIKGNLLTQMDALNHSVTYTYEPNFSQPTTFTDANSHMTVYSYDANGNAITIIAGFGSSQAQTVINTYDGLGDRSFTRDPNGKTTEFDHDNFGNLIGVVDPDRNFTFYTYDAAGRLQSVQDAKKNPPTVYTWDDADRLQKVLFPDGSFVFYTYDENGNRLSMTDSNLNTTNYDYDNRDRSVTITDANLHRTIYDYDIGGNPTTITDGNNHKTTFTYDDLSRLLSVTDSVHPTTSYTYDFVGNLQTRLDGNGQLTTYRYDAVNRPATVIYPDGSRVINTYDFVGNLVRRQETAVGTSSFQYDALNRMTSKTDAFGNHVSFQYDAAGNQVVLTYPGGNSVAYAYSPENQPVTLSSLQPGLFFPLIASYDANLNWKTLRYPNGILETNDYDPKNQLQHITRTANSPITASIPNVAYNYDPAGNRVNEAFNTNISEYKYDFTNQLANAGVTLPGLAPLQQVYTYDGAGNRVRFQQNHDVTVYTYDAANELTSKELERNVALWVPYERYAAAGVNAGGVQFHGLGGSRDREGRSTATFTPAPPTPTFTPFPPTPTFTMAPPTATPSFTFTYTPSPFVEPTATFTDTFSPSSTFTVSPTPTDSPTFTLLNLSTFTFSPTPSIILSPFNSSTFTSTPTPTFTFTPTITPTPKVKHHPNLNDPCLDSGDAFDNSGAVPVTSLTSLAVLGTPVANSKWVSNNRDGAVTTANEVVTFGRTFSISNQQVINQGVFTVTFEVGDNVDVIVNGNHFTGCGLPYGCGNFITTVQVPANLLQVGQNTIAFRVISLNLGPIALSYEFCGPFTATLGGTATVTPTFTRTLTPTGTISPAPSPCSTVVVFTDNFSVPASISNYNLYFVDGSPSNSVTTGFHVAGGFMTDSTTIGGDVGGTALLNQSFLGNHFDYTVEGDLEMDARTNGFGVFGLAFRAQNGGSYYSFQYNANPENQPPVWQVEKFGSGLIGSGVVAPAYSFGTTIHLKVIVLGNEFKCYVNSGTGDQLIYDVTDTNNPLGSGTVGLRTNSIFYPNVVRLANLTVSACAPVPTPTNTLTLTVTPTFTPTITPTPRRTPVLTQYTYDGNGNLVKEASGGVTTTYTYDFENRLKSITIPGLFTETYVYDYAGELLRRTTSQGTINYAYGQGVAPLAELKNFGPVAETDYLQLNGKTVGAIENGHNGRAKDTLFYHTDGVGSVLGITDGTGTVVAGELYDPFGVVLANITPNNMTNAYQFVGTYGVRHIELTGNNPSITFDHSIMGVRMYDASVGRFLSEDPLGFDADTNFYRYSGNNPVLFTDPTGLLKSNFDCATRIGNFLLRALAARNNPQAQADLKRQLPALIKSCECEIEKSPGLQKDLARINAALEGGGMFDIFLLVVPSDLLNFKFNKSCSCNKGT